MGHTLMDAKALVAERLERLPEIEPITPEMSEAAIAAAVARTLGRLNGAAYGTDSDALRNYYLSRLDELHAMRDRNEGTIITSTENAASLAELTGDERAALTRQLIEKGAATRVTDSIDRQTAQLTEAYAALG